MKIIVLVLWSIFQFSNGQFRAPYPAAGLRPSKQFSLPVKGKLEIYGPPPVKQISQQYGPPPPQNTETFSHFNRPQTIYGQPKNEPEPFNFQNPPTLNPNRFNIDPNLNTFPINQDLPIFNSNLQFRNRNFQITTPLPGFTRNLNNNQFDEQPNIQNKFDIERANVRELPKTVNNNNNLKERESSIEKSKFELPRDSYSPADGTTAKPQRRRPLSTTTESVIQQDENSTEEQPNVAIANSFAGRLYLQQPNGNLVLLKNNEVKLSKDALQQFANPNIVTNQNLQEPTLKSENPELLNPFYSLNVPIYQL